MMNRILATAVLSTMTVTGAWAASDTFDLTASQGATCVLNRATAAAPSIEIADLDEGDNDARANAVAGSYLFGDSYCNTQHQILVNVEAMERDGTGLPAGPVGSDLFDDEIDLSVSFANWHSSVGTFTAESDVNNGIASETSIPTFRNDAQNPGGGLDSPGFTVTVTTKATTHPLLEGPYEGSVEVTMLPQP